MTFYRKDQEDKSNTLNRCFFDAEHGWTTLALERLRCLHSEFPNDPQVHYAEGLIRKDFLGQGIKAEECFLAAHRMATDRSRGNQNYLFSTFNSAKYARNLDEYHRQESVFRHLAPDDPDLRLFDQINGNLDRGTTYSDCLSIPVAQYQQADRHGECAAFAELALQAGHHDLDHESGLRRSRMGALRGLDRAAEASRSVRGEGFPAEERVALQEALHDLDQLLAVDAEDHTDWNLKSAWLLLLDRPEEAVAAADEALSLCPVGYAKPLVNKALALVELGRREEAREVALQALDAAHSLGSEGQGDFDKAKGILAGIDTSPQPPDERLAEIAQRIMNAVAMTANQEAAQFGGSHGSSQEVLKGLEKRVSRAGQSWGTQYLSIIAQMLTLFCPETGCLAVAGLAARHTEEYQHCMHAGLYLAAQADGIMARDACRFLIYGVLGAMEPDKIRDSYRKAVLGPSTVGAGAFPSLSRRVREEMARLNPSLVESVADQPPLTDAESERARTTMMTRFADAGALDLAPTHLHRRGSTGRLFRRLLGRRE